MSGGVFKVVAELSTLLAYSAVKSHFVTKSAVATVSRVAVMTVTNYYMLQFFYNIPEAVVVGLLPVLAIFNASQALINILPAQLIHRRLPTFTT